MRWYNILQRIQKPRKEYTQQEPSDLPTIWIHGANQSSASFTYLLEKCNFERDVCVNYDSARRFYLNLDSICHQIRNVNQCFLIAHSMGGLYALHLLQRINVRGVVSISTPFHGSKTADWAKFVVPRYPLFRDVGRRSTPVRKGHKIEIDCPWTQIVSTTGGVPYHEGPNDGVCTVASMRHRKKDMEIVEIANTHYEVMVTPEVAEIIKNRYQKVAQGLSQSNGKKFDLKSKIIQTPYYLMKN